MKNPIKQMYNEKTAKEIIRLCSFGLIGDNGKPKEGSMCIENVVSYALGEKFSDAPSCVGSEIQMAKVALNDCLWTSNKARAKGMVKLGIAQLGSNTVCQEAFKQLLKLKSTQKLLPFLIQKHYDSLKKKDKKLLEYKRKFKSLTQLDDNLWKEFYNYDYNRYYYYHNYYHNYHYFFCKGDKFLLLVSNVILETLIELKSPGCQYLYLVKE